MQGVGWELNLLELEENDTGILLNRIPFKGFSTKLADVYWASAIV